MRVGAGVRALVLAPFLLGGGAGARANVLELTNPVVELEVARVPDTERLCVAGGVVRFQLGTAARVSLAVEGAPAPGSADGGPIGPLALVPLAAGPHEIVLNAAPRPSTLLVERPFTLSALVPGAETPVAVSGTLRDERIDRPVLPVGRTFLSGVDLLDGHLVLQTTDLDLEGRHFAIELTRTYSSAGRSDEGLVGAGWRLSYEHALTPLPECGLVVVRLADGGTQTFASAGPDFRPQRGYHTRLRRNGDGSFEFVDKAANRLRFAGRAAGTARSLRLEWMEEPHGDRIVLGWDGAGRLREVSETHPGLGPVRTVTFEYARAGGRSRIASAHAWGLGLRVRYTYDAAGNLVSATRTDRETASETTDSYEYTTGDARDPHQVAATAPTGEGRTAYRYSDAPAAPAHPVRAEPRELVVAVEAPGGKATTFAYSDGGKPGEYRTDVRDADGLLTRYVLNTDGNPLVIDEPEGQSRRVTRISWDSTHIVKAAEENNAGRRFRFEHDASGNLVRQQEWPRPGAAPETTTWAYDTRFNRLVFREDAKGVRSTWTLDPATGDLLRQEDPVGTVSAWTYDAHGCLREQRDAKGRTLFRRPDTFCNATEIHDPDGTVRRRRYDERGSLMDETETPVRHGGESPSTGPPPPPAGGGGG